MIEKQCSVIGCHNSVVRDEYCAEHFQVEAPKKIRVLTYDVELNKGWMIVKRKDRPVDNSNPYRNLSSDMAVYTVIESESDIYDVGDVVVAQYGADAFVHHADKAEDYVHALRDIDVIFRIPTTTV